MYRKSLKDIVRNRIGVDVFTSRMVRIRNVLNTFMAIGSTVDEGRDATLYDRCFAELFMETFDSILRIFTKTGKDSHYGLPRTVETFVETEDVSTFHTSQFEVESLRIQLQEMQVQQPSFPTSHEKNVESKCAYLTSENTRLQAMVDAYAEQLMLIERDNEELLLALGNCEAELGQLRQGVTGVDDSVPVEGSTLMDFPRPAPMEVSNHQSAQVKVLEHQLEQVNVLEHQTAPANVLEHQTAPLNVLNHQPEHSLNTDLPQFTPLDSSQSEPISDMPSTSPSKPTLQVRLEAFVHTTSPSTATHDV